MQVTHNLLSISRCLVVAAVAGLSLPASAAALFTLKGESPQVQEASDGEVRLSMLGWTETEAAEAVIDQYRSYQENGEHETFAEFLREQETQGYLFTTAATGYSIKYAWQEEISADSRMVLLVTPGLKTRNPYQWQQHNDNPAPFTLVELRWEGEQATLKTSLDGGITIDDKGRLALEDYTGASVFATVVDDTPYYLKDSA